MNRSELLKRLRAHKTTLVQNFGVTELALFGSFVRDQAADDSDVDILVQFYSEDLLSRQVDLVTDKALRAEIRPYVERDIINV